MTILQFPQPVSEGLRSAGFELLNSAESSLILAALPVDTVLVFDTDLRFLAVSGTGLAAIGLSREMLEGKTLRESFSSDVAAATEPRYREALAGVESTQDVEYAGRIFAQRIAPLRAADGAIVAGISIAHDVTDRRHSEQALALSEESFRLAFEHAPIGKALVGLDLRYERVNSAMSDLTGYSKEELVGLGVADTTHPDDLRRDLDAMESLLHADVPSYALEKRLLAPSGGGVVWVAESAALLRDGNGDPLRFIVQVKDISSRKESERLLAEAEIRLTEANVFQQAVISASPDITFVYDVGMQSTIWTSRSLAEALGYTENALQAATGDMLERLIPEADREAFNTALAAADDSADGEVIQLNQRMWHADGTVRWFSRRTCPMSRDESGHVRQLVGSLRDITDAVAAEELLQHSALHDSLTGLPNRALLVDRLDTALARSERDQREVAVLFCDLDGFKRINDTVGHAAGDIVLAETARRLRGVLRENDTVARVGGDEFVVVVEPWNREIGSDRKTLEDDRMLAVRVAERISEVLQTPVDVDGTRLVVTASVGVAYGRLTGSTGEQVVTSDEVLRDADAAMYRAKGLGKDRFEVFEHGLLAGLAERGRVEQLLRRALADVVPVRGFAVLPLPRTPVPELTASYQPVFESSTGRLMGFEALARLTDDHGLAIAPDMFIGVAEDAGIIRQLGARMLELACCQLAAWRVQVPGLDHVTMAINVSALQARHPSLIDDVRVALQTHGLQAADIILELTETILLEAGHSTLHALQLLHDEGAGVAIDDFGTGYFSLGYLATLPVSTIKVDKSFTAGLPDNSTSQKIVKAVAALAADMDLECIIEGVETAAQRAALPDGVQLQGYLTGRPQPPKLLDLVNLITIGCLAVAP